MKTVIGIVMTFSAIALFTSSAFAEDMTGVTATEIRIGNTAPYSGPAESTGTLTRAMGVYFDTVNRAGGIAGHKITFISRDDAYTPPKTLEQTRKLVEQDHVAFIYASIGTPTSLAVRKYLNDHKVPQLGINSGASLWNDPQHYPYSMSGIASYELDGKMVGDYVLRHVPKRQDCGALSER